MIAAELLGRVRDSMRRMMHHEAPDHAAGPLDAPRAEVAAAAIKAIRREIPHELLGVVETRDPAFGSMLAERLQLPVRRTADLEAMARGEGLVVEQGVTVEVRTVRREADRARVRLRLHTATGHRRHAAPVVTSEMEVVVARQPHQRRWRLVSRRIVLIA